MGFGINQADVQRALENQNTPSLDNGTVGVGSTTTVVEVSGQTLVASGYIGQSLVFNDNTTTTALQNVGAEITANTTTTVTLATALPATPVAGDTFVIRSLGGGSNISGVGGAPLTAFAGVPQVPVLTTTAPTLVNYVVSGRVASASTPIIYNYGKTNDVFATVGVGTKPYGVATDATTNTIYVTNFGSNTVSVIDGATNTVTATVAVGAYPTAVATDATTNTIYVANSGGNTVSVIDGATNTVTATVAVGADPTAVATDATTNTIYVANGGGNTVSVIDGATNAVTATVAVGLDPYGIAVDATTNTIYVANRGSNTVSVIDGATNTVTATVGVGADPTAVAVTIVGSRAYVTNFLSNTINEIQTTGRSHYLVTTSGTLLVNVAVSALSTLSVSHNASAPSPSYNTLEGGAQLVANSEYSLSIRVAAGDSLDFELGAGATINVLSVWFIATQ